MKYISFIVRKDPLLLQNQIFENDSLYGMKSDNYPFKALKSALLKLGYEFNTFDITPPEKADLIICLDEVEIYKQLNINGISSFLIISEPPVYTPENWKKENHKYFNKVFTYDLSLCDSSKYIHYVFPIEFEKHPHLINVKEGDYIKRNLSTLIAGAFQISKPKKGSVSLLHERFVLMNWFSKNAPNDLHFYSRNFSSKSFEFFKGASLLNKLKLNNVVKFISKIKARSVDSVYKGSLPPLEKIVKQQNYNFSFCFENSKNINGCISERIFDCFAASSVPIYFGAPDIEKWIPNNCFIDFRGFKSYSELYEFIKEMPFNTYSNYLENIQKFLNSNQIDKFKVSSYVNKIINEINTL